MFENEAATEKKKEKKNKATKKNDKTRKKQTKKKTNQEKKKKTKKKKQKKKKTFQIAQYTRSNRGNKGKYYYIVDFINKLLLFSTSCLYREAIITNSLLAKKA